MAKTTLEVNDTKKYTYSVDYISWLGDDLLFNQITVPHKYTKFYWRVQKKHPYLEKYKAVKINMQIYRFVHWTRVLLR